jgi:hypothetical protein
MCVVRPRQIDVVAPSAHEGTHVRVLVGRVQASLLSEKSGLSYCCTELAYHEHDPLDLKQVVRLPVEQYPEDLTVANNRVFPRLHEAVSSSGSLCCG